MKKKDIPWVLLLATGVVLTVVSYNRAFPEPYDLSHYLTIIGLSLLVWVVVTVLRFFVESSDEQPPSKD